MTEKTFDLGRTELISRGFSFEVKNVGKHMQMLIYLFLNYQEQIHITKKVRMSDVFHFLSRF